MASITGIINGGISNSSGTTTTVIDHHHPLYLQACNTPGSSLVPIQLTGSENYALWSRSMRIGLLGKSKLGFVDGRHTKEKFEPALYDLWEKCNAIVLSWIMISVSKELLSGIVYASNAQKVWSDLKERFDKVDGLRIFFLHKEITTLVQGTSSRLMQFLMGLNDSYNQCRSQIMMLYPPPTVNKAYSLVISEEGQRVLAKSNSVNITDISDGMSFFGGKNTFNSGAKQGGTSFEISDKDGTSYNGGYRGGQSNINSQYYRKGKPSMNSGFSGLNHNNNSNYRLKKINLYCDYCNWKGHTKGTCYKLHGYPSDSKGQKKNLVTTNAINYAGSFDDLCEAMPGMQLGNYFTDERFAAGGSTMPHFTHEQYQQILQLLERHPTFANKVGTAGTMHSSISLTDDNKWIADSGASKHMVHNMNLLSNVKMLNISRTDAGYLSDPHKVRTQTGYVFTYGGTAIAWRSTKQSIIATSSNHAEIIAIHEASRECIWLRSIVHSIKERCGLKLDIKVPTIIFTIRN
ncbi:hypothetical protein P3L10_029761 [Capsicum annuum]